MALDAGAVGFSDALRILVSCDVSGQTMVEERLYRFEGRQLRPPQSSYPPPARDYVTWHRKEVFRAPARTGRYPRVQVGRDKAAEDKERYTPSGP
jgi:hypothetical protein